ncbi:MAG: PCMD domain-containing protein [Prevotella sp.]|nr:PCMD domain-containing protein [Prevotella sp.]
MKRISSAIVSMAIALSADAQYQVRNAGFEAWETVTYNSKSGEEPVHWNSFLDGTGGLKGIAGASQTVSSTDVRPGSAGSRSAKIYSRDVMFGMTAQGNLTSGCVNMGSISAGDAKGNFNYTNLSVPGQNMPFTGKPDAMHVWVKFTGSTYKAKATTLLHTAGTYQDPYSDASDVMKNATQKAQLVATATNTEIVSKDDWQELTIPFTYADASLTPAYALVSFATSAQPGKGTAGDAMLIDDLTYLYYSELVSVTYEGQPVTVSAEMTVDAPFDEGLLRLQANGVGATVETAYEEASGVLTVTVKGNDYNENAANQHVYRIRFRTDVEAFTLADGADLRVAHRLSTSKLTYTRVFEAGQYATFMLPVSCAADAVNGSVYELTGMTNDAIDFSSVTRIEANKPYMVKPEGTSLFKESGPFTICPVTPETTGEAAASGIRHIGVCRQTVFTTDADTRYYDCRERSLALGNALTVAPGHTVFAIQASGEAKSAYLLRVDGVPTGIATVKNGQLHVTPAEAYDLQGRRVAPSSQGIRIIGGRKVIVR